MKPWQRAWIGIAILAFIGYLLDGNEDPQVWGALFWVSAIANLVLYLLLHNKREENRILRTQLISYGEMEP